MAAKEIGVPPSFEVSPQAVQENIDNPQVLSRIGWSKVRPYISALRKNVYISTETPEEAVQNQRRELQECYECLNEEPDEIINHIVGRRSKREVDTYLSSAGVEGKLTFLEYNHIYELWKHVHHNIQPQIEPQKRLHIGENFSVRLDGRKSPPGYVLRDFRLRREYELSLVSSEENSESNIGIQMVSGVEYPVLTDNNSNT